MKSKLFSQYKWVLIVSGIVMGLALAGGLEITSHSTANELPAEQPALQQTSVQGMTIAQQLSKNFADIAAQTAPSVVMIFTEKTVHMTQPMIDFPFGDFFGTPNPFGRGRGQQRQQDLKQHGLGSGVIVDAEGVILTNNHVVSGADEIKVRLADGREFKAKVKGTDKQTDLAVITIDADNLKAIKLGDSDKARVGELVLAIGSPLNPNLDHTVTRGIISGKGRSGVGLNHYEDFIQTDAAINPGNSGGALVNMKGELIGINAAIASKSGGFMGIGFAVPVNLARKVMHDLIENGKVTRGWLGVYIQNVSSDMAKALDLKAAKGVIVSKVQADSPAEKAGLKEEDVILTFNGKTVDNNVALSTWVAGSSPGDKIKLGILRDGESKTVTVTLGELDNKVLAEADGSTSFSDVGITVSNLTDKARKKYDIEDLRTGVIITSVKQGSAAMEAGLREGDAIIKVNRRPIKNTKDLKTIFKKLNAGDHILMFIRRGDANIFVPLAIPEK